MDEHVWHRLIALPVEPGGRGPKELTRMVDLTCDSQGRVRARLLDLVPGRSGETYRGWLAERGEDVRRRVQQETTGHRVRKGDPLYRVRDVLRAGEENLTDRQRARLEAAFTARAEHVEVEGAYRCAQQVRSAYHQASHAAGRAIAEKVLAALPTCPIPEVARLGKALRQWRQAFLGYFDTEGARATAARKPSTASSSSTAASPAASATATTTASECSSSPAGYTREPPSGTKSRQCLPGDEGFGWP